MAGFKLVINCQAAPRKRRDITPHSSNCYPIHLGCHSWRLHASGHSDPLRLFILPAFKKGPLPRSRERSPVSFPTGLHFVVFAFVREPRS
ncbi:hypothetical protein AVEN_166411-1 [Araneus ventricosus]|uniref:Uncharacterized protein n=1 Tax=Araneus ventricosus TaxID=182803 RepID=A0A4Y2U1N7_ARAVE|nr:hypothetical protein AVEN_166411-1 [Araneus ventricosus]